MIIERSSPNSSRTIPLQSNGFYVLNGISFRFIEGDEDYKKVGHELRNRSLILSCHVDNLFTPLISIVDFLGFRILVTA